MRDMTNKQGPRGSISTAQGQYGPIGPTGPCLTEEEFNRIMADLNRVLNEIDKPS